MTTPRHVRNFWLEVHVDGKQETVALGPAHNDGGFSATITMRHQGRVLKAVDIKGRVCEDVILVLDIADMAGDQVITVTTTR